LADFGVHARDHGMASLIKTVLSHQSPQGAFQTMVNIPAAFGGTNEEMWTWMACDAPTLLYVPHRQRLCAQGARSSARPE
jgi:hypothetical protein